MKIAIAALSYRPQHPLRQAARDDAEKLGWDSVIVEFESRLAAIAGIEPEAVPKPAKPGKRARFDCRTVILSDIHLGTPDSKANEVVDFLKRIRCGKLILNGDIIDGWALRRGGKWSSRHSRVIRKVLKMTEKDDTEVIYLWRSWRGKEYFSLSKRVKAKVKSAVSFVDRYEMRWQKNPRAEFLSAPASIRCWKASGNDHGVWQSECLPVISAGISATSGKNPLRGGPLSGRVPGVIQNGISHEPHP